MWLVTGPTGSGKSWLACALAQYAWGHAAVQDALRMKGYVGQADWSLAAVLLKRLRGVAMV